jgi:hypothetical protein
MEEIEGSNNFAREILTWSKREVSDYQKLDRIIHADKRNFINCKPLGSNHSEYVDKNGRIEIPYLDIQEDCPPVSYKCGQFFIDRTLVQGRSRIMPYIRIDGSLSEDFKFNVLTHEYGHYLSWKNKMRPDGYEIAMALYSNRLLWPRMTDEDKGMILGEEKLAWDLGIDFVKRSGFKLSPAFHRRKRSALLSYKKGLGI